MKKYLKIFYLIVSLTFFISISIYGISRNHNKDIFDNSILFSNTNIFLNDSIVNKLLTQILDVKYMKGKDILDLNMIETEFEKNPFIERAEVYWKFYDVLEVRIKEREPLYILSKSKYYVDSNSCFFPIEKKIKKDLPVVLTKLSKVDLKSVTTFILQTSKDSFLKKELNKIHIENNQFRIGLKSYNFDIIFGDLKRFKEKVRKLKVFCAFQKVQDSLVNYSLINLNYLNQVIASKSLVYGNK